MQDTFRLVAEESQGLAQVRVKKDKHSCGIELTIATIDKLDAVSIVGMIRGFAIARSRDMTHITVKVGEWETESTEATSLKGN